MNDRGLHYAGGTARLAAVVAVAFVVIVVGGLMLVAWLLGAG